MKTIKDYHDLNLRCDVLLLGDVIEKFRKHSTKNYGLCPSHYLSSPALSWDEKLNMAKVESYINAQQNFIHWNEWLH